MISRPYTLRGRGIVSDKKSIKLPKSKIIYELSSCTSPYTHRLGRRLIFIFALKDTMEFPVHQILKEKQQFFEEVFQFHHQIRTGR